MSKYNEPRITMSKKTCTCPETGEEILKGQDCLWVPDEKKAYSLTSEKAQQFKVKSKS